MCSGVGACRKTLSGTMCPSYMATRDEAHSTRGRANALRLAMTGALGLDGPREAGLGERGVHDVLDLCLECRACKTECPVGVDMARFKSEFLADYQRRHGTPLRARVLGHIHDLSALASRAAPLLNPWLARGWVRRLNETVFGIDRRRSLPAWAPRTLAAAWGDRPSGGRGEARAPGARVLPTERTGAASATGNGAVTAGNGEAATGDGAAAPDAILFADTFTNYYDPDIGLAAADVLEAAGLAVGLGPDACCGRPLISQGLLGAARDRAADAVRRLHPLAAAGTPIVLLEPSCLSALIDDAPALLRGEAQQQAREVATACVLFEDFLNRRLDDGSASLALGSGPEEILLHGHCHQKSLGLVGPARALLDRIPGARSPTSIPVAAAWRARSDTRASTSTSPARSASCASCRPRGSSARAASSWPPARRAGTRSTTSPASGPCTRHNSCSRYWSNPWPTRSREPTAGAVRRTTGRSTPASSVRTIGSS